MNAIISLPITPNRFWGFDKRIAQDKLHHPVLSLWGKLDNLLHQNTLREFVGVINFTSVTPEIFGGIYCVILEGPMVHAGFLSGRLFPKHSQLQLDRVTGKFYITVIVFAEKEKHININKFAGLSPRLGGYQKVVYVFFFFFSGHSLWGRKTHKQNSPQNPGTIPWKFCLRVLFFMCFFAPYFCWNSFRHYILFCRKYCSAEIILLYVTSPWPQPLSCTSFLFTLHYITKPEAN